MGPKLTLLQRNTLGHQTLNTAIRVNLRHKQRTRGTTHHPSKPTSNTVSTQRTTHRRPILPLSHLFRRPRNTNRPNHFRLRRNRQTYTQVTRRRITLHRIHSILASNFNRVRPIGPTRPPLIPQYTPRVTTTNFTRMFSSNTKFISSTTICLSNERPTRKVSHNMFNNTRILTTRIRSPRTRQRIRFIRRPRSTRQPQRQRIPRSSNITHTLSQTTTNQKQNKNKNLNKNQN